MMAEDDSYASMDSWGYKASAGAGSRPQGAWGPGAGQPWPGARPPPGWQQKGGWDDPSAGMGALPPWEIIQEQIAATATAAAAAAAAASGRGGADPYGYGGYGGYGGPRSRAAAGWGNHWDPYGEGEYSPWDGAMMDEAYPASGAADYASAPGGVEGHFRAQPREAGAVHGREGRRGPEADAQSSDAASGKPSQAEAWLNAGEDEAAGTGEPSDRDEAFAQDLSSAVHAFLSGDLFEEGSEDEEEDPEDLQPSGGSSSPLSPASPPVARPGAVGPPPGVFTAAGSRPAPPGLTPGRAAGPVRAAPPGLTPEGVQDFLKVLRRRALPVAVAGEQKAKLEQLISACVRSLYTDRIRPVQSVVQRRLRERACGEEGIQALLPLCARDVDQYRILPPVHGEQPVILLAAEPRDFGGWIDVEAAEGGYSQDVWDAFSAFLSDESPALPGQPYQAALELRERSLPRLRGLSLAELEHVVRLALGNRRLLCHHGSALLPLRSAKEARAAKSRGAPTPAASMAVRPAPDDIADLDELAAALAAVTKNFPNGVSLSTLKGQVLQHCRRNVNEAVFKCSKLADVFKLAPLIQMFSLEPSGPNGELVVKPLRSAPAQGLWPGKLDGEAAMPRGGLPPGIFAYGVGQQRAPMAMSLQ